MTDEFNEYAHICRIIYPQEYREKCVLNIGELPLEINQRISSFRDIEELVTSTDTCKMIIGFGQSAEKDSLLQTILFDKWEYHDDKSRTTKMLSEDLQLALLFFHRNSRQFQTMEFFQKDRKIAALVSRAIACQFRFADISLRSDKNYIHSILRHPQNRKFQTTIVPYIPSPLRDDTETMLLATQQFAYAVAWASDRLQDDVDFMTFAVKRHYLTVQYSSHRVRDDSDFMTSAVKIHHDTAEYASFRLRDNCEFMLMVIGINNKTFSYATPRLKDDETFVVSVMKKNRKLVKLASSRLQEKLSRNSLPRRCKRFRNLYDHS